MKQTRQFKVIIERDEDGYFVASVPALPGCYTQAKDLDALHNRIKEVISLCLDVAKKILHTEKKYRNSLTNLLLSELKWWQCKFYGC